MKKLTVHYFNRQGTLIGTYRTNDDPSEHEAWEEWLNDSAVETLVDADEWPEFDPHEVDTWSLSEE